MNKCILLLAYLRMLGIGGLEKFGEFNRSVVQHCLWPYFYGSVCALAVNAWNACPMKHVHTCAPY